MMAHEWSRPPVVVTEFMFSHDFSGWARILPLLLMGTAAAIWANCFSSILLKFNWSFIEEVKFYSLKFMLSIFLSWWESFLLMFSLILACPSTRIVIVIGIVVRITLVGWTLVVVPPVITWLVKSIVDECYVGFGGSRFPSGQCFHRPYTSCVSLWHWRCLS